MKNFTKKAAFFISLLCIQQLILPVNIYQTQSSQSMPVNIFIEDATKQYQKTKPSKNALYYYKVTVKYNFFKTVNNHSISSLADVSFAYPAGTLLVGTSIATIYLKMFFLSSNRCDSGFDFIVFSRTQPLNNVKIDIVKTGSFMNIYLIE